MPQAKPLEPPKDLEEFRRRVWAVLQKESDIEEYVDNPLDHIVELRALLTSYATGEEKGAVEPRILLVYFNDFLAKLAEAETKRPDIR